MTVNDIIDEQNQLKAHTHDITMWPFKWKTYLDKHIWEIHELQSSSVANIPNESGIYTLLIIPAIADHPACSYLMYVGKAKSLQVRFRQYLTSERRESGRPKMYRLLNIYSDYMFFCFTRVNEIDLNTVENALIDAYVPCCNDQLPANLSPVKRGAF